MGGFCSNRRTRSRALLLNHSVARIRPVTSTASDEPVRTVMLPDPVLMSRSTGPETFSVRWNDPSTAATAGHATGKEIRTRSKTNDDEIRDRIVIASLGHFKPVDLQYPMRTVRFNRPGALQK